MSDVVFPHTYFKKQKFKKNLVLHEGFFHNKKNQNKTVKHDKTIMVDDSEKIIKHS